MKTDWLIEASIQITLHAFNRARGRMGRRACPTGATGTVNHHLSATPLSVGKRVTLGGWGRPSHDEVLTNHDYRADDCR